MELLQIKMLNTAIERVMNQEMASLGLTYTQATILGYLIENSGHDVCQKEIEYSLGLTHPTVSSILSRMEANGMIVASPMQEDHRYKKVEVTEKALGLSEAVSKKYKAVKEVLYNGVSPAQRELMNVTAQMMLKNLQ